MFYNLFVRESYLYICESYFFRKFLLYLIILGGMPGLQNIMKQLQQGAAGGLGNLMGGFGGKS